MTNSQLYKLALLAALALFPALACAQTNKQQFTKSDALELHSRCVVLDSHADTPLDFAKGEKLTTTNPKIQVSLPRMQRGGVNAQYLACWVKQGPLTHAGRIEARRRINQLIDSCYSQVQQNDSVCGIASNAAEVRALHKEGKIAFLIGVENGYGIGQNLSIIDDYKERGVSYITLCHTRNNDICDSSSDKAGPRWHGLSPFGEQVVRRMNELGILIDLSHASAETFWDVLKITQRPVVCTHSGASAVYKHNRNLTDDQLRALTDNGGVIQIDAVDDFLRRDAKSATIDDYMAHLLHAIEIAGIDHVGIGSDFDGGGGVKGFNGSDDMVNVTLRLMQLGYSEQDIAKVLGGNFMRVLEAAQK